MLRPTRVAVKPPKRKGKAQKPKHPRHEPTHVNTKVARHALRGRTKDDK
jgi:hypothetical protein